MLLKNPT